MRDKKSAQSKKSDKSTNSYTALDLNYNRKGIDTFRERS